MARSPSKQHRSVPDERTHVLGLDGLVALALALLVYLAFRSALTAQFVNIDDEALIHTWAPRFQLSGDPIAFAFTTTEMGHYQPLTWLSWTLDFASAGLDPRAYHRTNVLLHATSAMLLYFVVRRLLATWRPDASRVARTAAAAIATALWAVHPLRVESVAWVTERRDV